MIKIFFVNHKLIVFFYRLYKNDKKTEKLAFKTSMISNSIVNSAENKAFKKNSIEQVSKVNDLENLNEESLDDKKAVLDYENIENITTIVSNQEEQYSLFDKKECVSKTEEDVVSNEDTDINLEHEDRENEIKEKEYFNLNFPLEKHDSVSKESIDSLKPKVNNAADLISTLKNDFIDSNELKENFDIVEEKENNFNNYATSVENNSNEFVEMEENNFTTIESNENNITNFRKIVQEHSDGDMIESKENDNCNEIEIKEENYTHVVETKNCEEVEIEENDFKNSLQSDENNLTNLEEMKEQNFVDQIESKEITTTCDEVEIKEQNHTDLVETKSCEEVEIEENDFKDSVQINENNSVKMENDDLDDLKQSEMADTVETDLEKDEFVNNMHFESNKGDEESLNDKNNVLETVVEQNEESKEICNRNLMKKPNSPKLVVTKKSLNTHVQTPHPKTQKGNSSIVKKQPPPPKGPARQSISTLHRKKKMGMYRASSEKNLSELNAALKKSNSSGSESRTFEDSLDPKNKMKTNPLSISSSDISKKTPSKLR